MNGFGPAACTDVHTKEDDNPLNVPRTQTDNNCCPRPTMLISPTLIKACPLGAHSFNLRRVRYIGLHKTHLDSVAHCLKEILGTVHA